MNENSVVEKVHLVRTAMLAKHGGDLHALLLEAERFEVDPSIAAHPFKVQDTGADWDGTLDNPLVDEIHRIRAEMLAERTGDDLAVVADKSCAMATGSGQRESVI